MPESQDDESFPDASEVDRRRAVAAGDDPAEVAGREREKSFANIADCPRSDLDDACPAVDAEQPRPRRPANPARFCRGRKTGRAPDVLGTRNPRSLTDERDPGLALQGT